MIWLRRAVLPALAAPCWMVGLVADLGCTGRADVVAREGDATVYDPATPPLLLPLQGDLEAHDPSVVEADGAYYLFSTGIGIVTKTSPDLLNWTQGSPVFAENPAWIAEQVPGATSLWSPTVVRLGADFHLFYAASTFGNTRSCVGHAKKRSLSSDAAWEDLGFVLCSNVKEQVDAFNAIDPAVLIDTDGTAHLAFGSFTGGILLAHLDQTARTASTPVPLAARPEGDHSIQAAFLHRRGDFFYLFSSFDWCCRGVDSTHRIVVGRSSQLEGPYLDRAGEALLEGGGTLLLEGDPRFRGPGSNEILLSKGRAYNIYRAYDAEDSGRPKLRIAEIAWDDAGWPVSAGP